MQIDTYDDALDIVVQQYIVIVVVCLVKNISDFFLCIYIDLILLESYFTRNSKIFILCNTPNPLLF